MKNLLSLIIITLALQSCNNGGQDAEPYAFFVAGHTYGMPQGENQGLHPPFIEAFKWLNEEEDIHFGILTGDIVRKSDIESWDSVDAQLSGLNKTVYLCPGNHDTYNRELFESRYGSPYYSFQYYNDLFIVLDGSLDHWNILDDQLIFLQEKLTETDKKHGHIFIFVHQLIWWDDDNIFSRVNLNWPPYTPDTTNYWSDIEPILQGLRSPVVFFAGDLGANNRASPVMFHQDNNITYIASGMGSITNDNIIIAWVDPDQELRYELICLGKDKYQMGLLEDYVLE